MKEDNIYEILGISIYCTYPELMESYINYRRKMVQKKSKEEKSLETLESENKWLKGVKRTYEEDRTEYLKLQYDESDNGKLLGEYNKHLNLSRGYFRAIEKIDQLFRENNLNNYSSGEEQKAAYDSTHKTPDAILGIALATNFELITAKDKAKQIMEKYPGHEEEIMQAAEIVEKQEQIVAPSKEEKIPEKQEEQVQEMKEEPKSENAPKAKIGFRNWVKRIFAPALAVIGITVTVPKLLPEGEKEEPAKNPTLIEEVTPESFKDKIRVQGVIYDENGMQIIPDEATRQSILNPNERSTETAREPKAQVDILAKFKAKMQNDSGLRDVVEQSLRDIAIDNNYDASPYDKVDYIISSVENQDKNCAMSYTQSRLGIKEYILNCIDNTILYYIGKETGENGLTMRDEKQGFSIISNDGTRYVATTYKDVAKTSNTNIGTRKTLSNFANYTLAETKNLRNTYIRDYYTNIDSTIKQVGSLFTSLNNIGDKPLVVDRDVNEMEI